MPRRRRHAQIIGFCAFLFIIALLPLFWNNRLDRIRAVDFLQILAAGAILGVMITNIFRIIRQPAAN